MNYTKSFTATAATTAILLAALTTTAFAQDSAMPVMPAIPTATTMPNQAQPAPAPGAGMVNPAVMPRIEMPKIVMPPKNTGGGVGAIHGRSTGDRSFGTSTTGDGGIHMNGINVGGGAVKAPGVKVGMDQNGNPIVKAPGVKVGVDENGNPVVKAPGVRVGMDENGNPVVKAPGMRVGQQGENASGTPAGGINIAGIHIPLPNIGFGPGKNDQQQGENASGTPANDGGFKIAGIRIPLPNMGFGPGQNEQQPPREIQMPKMLNYGDASSTQSMGDLGAMFEKQNAKVKDLVSKVQEKADQALTNRVEALTALSQRIGEMKQLTDTQKTELQTEMANQISSLVNLKGEIATQTSTSTLKADVQSITNQFRTYVLTIPKTAVLASVDRVTTLSGDMQTISAKLQSIIDGAVTKGIDVTEARNALADYNSKVAAAQSLATSAKDAVSALMPDGGVKEVFDANNAALKAAGDKMKQAQQDLVSARNDIKTIRQLLSQQGAAVTPEAPAPAPVTTEAAPATSSTQ